MTLKQTSLYEKHLDLKAKMAPFAGFDMPLQYTSVKEEVIAVRENVGVFDVSHMGEFFVEGPDAAHFVDHLLSNDFLNAENLKAVYSPMCREDGTIIDDLIAYKFSDHKVLICVNASNIDKDWDWIISKSDDFECQLSNRSDTFSLLAVQGPKTREVLKKISVLEADEETSYYSVLTKQIDGEGLILARTGYTGEDGFEIFCTHKTAVNLWDKLLAAGVTPCGLASRDVLRLEVCYPLYGHELNDEVTPLDSGLKWTVKMDASNFIGKEALESYEAKYRLVKLSLDKGIPREGYPVLNEEEEEIGIITSGTMSVQLGVGIALARIEKAKFPENKKFLIKIRKNNIAANYHTKPFISGGHK